jgi:hypothetical protein
MRPILRIFILVVGAVAIVPLPVRAQAQPEVRRLASQTAKKVAATYARRILTTQLAGCLVVAQLCTELDAALRSELERSIPGSQLISREEAIKHLTQHGFLHLDAYLGALDNVASDVGAEAVIDEGFRRKGNDCVLYITVTDAKHLYSLADFDVHLSCLAIPVELKASLLKDAETGVSLIIPAIVPAPQGIRAPSCVQCPHIMLARSQEGFRD